MRQTAPEPAVDTRQRLLEAAGEVFAEVGFRAARVRDICARATANIAAVNYHFGDKRGLYVAVFAYAHACAMNAHPPPADLGQPPAQRLEAYVREFLLRLLDEGRPAWHGRLMAREMIEPSDALDQLVERAIRPQFVLLTGILRDLGAPDEPRALRRLCWSVVAQCLFYHHAQPIIGRLVPGWRPDAAELAGLTAHITAFSLAGIAAAGAAPVAAARGAKAAKGGPTAKSARRGQRS